MYDITKLTLKQLRESLEDAPGSWHPFGMVDLLAEGIANWGQTAQTADRRVSLVQSGEELLEQPIAPLKFADFIRFGGDGDRQAYETSYFERRRRLAVYALLYTTSGEERWLRVLEEIIWLICDEYTWVIPAHVGLYVRTYPEHIWDQPQPPRETVDLFAGETAFALAEIVHLCKDALHPWIVHRVYSEVERRIFQVYYGDAYPQNWKQKTNNWPAVCASSIGAAALYLEQDPERLAGMLWRVIGVLRQFLSGFDAQGATPEGISYWQYGFGMYVSFAELLQQRTGGAIDLLQGEHIAAIAAFPHACLLSAHRTVNFSDAAECPDLIRGLFYRLNQRFPKQAYRLEELSFGKTRRAWIWSIRELIWADCSKQTLPSEQEETPGTNTEKVRHFYFPGHQWAISQTTNRDGLLAWAAKGGNNAEPHNHNDIGHFILHVRGCNVLLDLGVGIYSRQYFQPHYRYAQLQAGSYGHSVPIVDGVCQGWGEAHRAEVLTYSQHEEQITFALDLTQAYPCAHLQRLTRTFIWDRTTEQSHHVLLLKDEAQFTQKPGRFEEVFMCAEEPQEDQPGRLRVGPDVVLVYDNGLWSWQAEQVELPAKDGGAPLVWRLMMDCKQTATEITAAFRFELADGSAGE